MSQKGQIFLSSNKTTSYVRPFSHLLACETEALFMCIFVYLMCIFVTSCVLFYYVRVAVLHTLVAGLLARSQYSEGPATGHLGTGFSWFRCV
jgi:hypothetical protein